MGDRIAASVTLTVDVPVLVPGEASEMTLAEAKAAAQRLALEHAQPPVGLEWDSADVEIVTRHHWLPPEDERPEPPEWAWVTLPGVPGRWASNGVCAIREDAARPLHIPAASPWRRPSDAMVAVLAATLRSASWRANDELLIDVAYRPILSASDGVVQAGNVLACLRAGDPAPHALVMPFGPRAARREDRVEALSCLDRTGWPDA